MALNSIDAMVLGQCMLRASAAAQLCPYDNQPIKKAKSNCKVSKEITFIKNGAVTKQTIELQIFSKMLLLFSLQ